MEENCEKLTEKLDETNTKSAALEYSVEKSFDKQAIKIENTFK